MDNNIISKNNDQVQNNEIETNINNLDAINKEKEQEKIRNLYKSANDNETEALKIQMQLRDKINSRLKTEKTND